MTVVPLQALPLGFRFHPTDEELVNHYLKRKINGRIRSEVEVIPEIDVCKCEPWDLPDKSLIRSDDPEWFFFSPKDRKYPNGHRSNRATEAGYWKATGKDRTIRSKTAASPGVIGMKKTLVFHQGRAPKGVRTNWIMHEYRATEPEFISSEQGGYVLYRLFRKTEEKTPGLNGDEVDRSGLSPTPTKSSLDYAQHDGEALEELDMPATVTPISQISPDPDLQDEQPSSTTAEKRPAAITRWLADQADRSSLKPENSSNCHLSMDVKGDPNTKDAGTMVDPLLVALERFCDPQNEPIDTAGFPNITSPMLPYSDHPFFGNTDQKSAMGFAQAGYVEQDCMNDFLNSILSNQDEYCSGGSNVRHTSTTEPVHSRSSSDLDTEERLVQGALSFGSPGWCYADASTYCFPEFNNSVPYENPSLFLHNSNVPDVYSVDSGADSLQELFNNMDESTGHTNVFNTGFGHSGTGIELRSRPNQPPSAGQLPVQGSAKRRTILVSSVKSPGVFSMKCESCSDEENYEDTEAAVKVGEEEDSTIERKMISDKEDQHSSGDLRELTCNLIAFEAMSLGPNTEGEEELDDIDRGRENSEVLQSCKSEESAIYDEVVAWEKEDEASHYAISHESELLVAETGTAHRSEITEECRTVAEACDEFEPKLRLRTKPTSKEIIESERLKAPTPKRKSPTPDEAVSYISRLIVLLVIVVLIYAGIQSWGSSESVPIAGGSL